MSKNIYALLVGIDRYAPNSDNLSELLGCENDIEEIETYLKNQVAKEWKFNPKKLINEQATRQEIIKGFQQHLIQAEENDIALFYYSGHGGQEKADEQFRRLEPDGINETLICYDSRTPGNHDLADKELRYLLFQVAKKNPRVIVILDSCHSGTATRNIPQGVRRASKVREKRDFSDFIFAEDTTFFNDLLSTSEKVNKKKTGLELPKGKHILFTACRDFQDAKEYLGDNGKERGAFSYFLLKTLEQSNGSLSYLDLARNTEALIRGNVREQVPQIEATNQEDLKESFLGNAIPERLFYFTLSYGTHSNKGWSIDGGVIQGIPKSFGDETTLLAIFPVGSKPDDLKQVAKALGEAKVTKVLTQKSQVEITQGLENLDENQSYWAVVTSLPLKLLKVYLQGENTEVALASKEIAQANLGQKSLYIEQVDNLQDADLCLQAERGKYEIIQDKLPLIAPLNNVTEAIQALEAIARWRNTLNLKSPQRSQIKSGDVEMQIKLIGYEDRDRNTTNHEKPDLLANTPELRLEYQYQDGQWQKPVIQIQLLNHSQKKLYANVIDLAADYSIQGILYEDDTKIRSSVVLPEKTESKTGIFANQDITLSIPDDFLDRGVTEYKDIFKLIVSETDFSAELREQEGFEPPPRTRGAAPKSSLALMFDRIYSRNAAPAGIKYDDWITKEITVTIVKPRDAEELTSDRPVQLLDNLVEIQPHSDLQAKATLTTVAQTTRDIGNLTVPPALRDDGEAIAPFQFTTSRGSDPGLSVLELLDVRDFKSVTREQPLNLTIARSLDDDEYLLPVSYDGEFFLPLGFGIKRKNKIEVTLECLPQPTTSSRSLGGSIKIFFKKLRHQKLGHSYEYPILAAAEVAEIDNRFQVSYQKDLAKVKQQVANAQKILLYIHGIIGDTESLVTSVQQAKVKINGQQRPLREAYDLVLTFDYENLHTTIDENARRLKDRLESVGLGANHGKELQIVAHSMGGLISRWLIEREGGNEIVQHLVMLGTPNAGSPWSTVQDMTFALLGMGLNQIAGFVPPAEIITDLFTKSLQFIEENDNSLDQMRPDDEFIKAIATNPDPQVAYTIIAGDRSTVLQQQSNRLRRLMNKLFTPAINKVLDDLIFGGEPHDIAVSVASIQSVSRDRSPQPKTLPSVACDHTTYFTSEPGLKALVDALDSD